MKRSWLTKIEKPQLLLALAIVGMLTLIFFYRGYNQRISYTSGDEPHYLMMTDSLIKDGDFNLYNDYQLGRSKNYYPGDSLLPHTSDRINLKSDRWYSIHSVGLPFLLAIPYGLGGPVGARIFMLLLQGSTILVFCFLLKKHVKDKKRVAIGTALLLACSLFWQNVGAFSPDLITVLLWGLILSLFGSQGKKENIFIMALFLLAVLTHTKALTLTLPVLVMHWLWLVRDRGIVKTLKKHYLPVIGAGVIGIAYINYLHRNYGVYTPNKLYDGPNSQLFNANIYRNLVAMLFDRSKGALVYFPVLSISFIYLMRLASKLKGSISSTVFKKGLSKDQFLAIGCAVGLAGLLVTQLGFTDWSGSVAPNGRYLLPFVYVAIFLIAKLVDYKNKFEFDVLSVLAVLSLTIAVYALYSIKGYLSAGVDSPWVMRFSILKKLPLFGLSSNDNIQLPMSRGTTLFAALIVSNIVLLVLYKRYNQPTNNR